MESENAVVGMALYEQDLIPEIKDRLPSPDYFRTETNKKIIQTIYKMHSDDQDVTPITLAEKLEGEDLAKIGGSSALAEMAQNYSVLDSDGFESVIEQVKQRYIKRESRRELERAENKIKGSENPVSVLQKITAKLDQLQSEQVNSEIHHIGESAGDLYEKLEQAKENGALPGNLSTGFPELDERMKGISKNDFILLSADTGVGKTSMALQIADTVADGQNKNALIFSGEMHGTEILMKILSKRGAATLDEMQDGDIGDKQWNRLVNEITQINESGLYTIRESQPTIYDFKAAVRRADNEYGIDFAVLDYVQMLDNPSPKKMDSVEHLNLVSSEIRDFTNDMDIPVLAISRENKGGEIYGSSQLKYDCSYRLVIVDPEPNDDETNRRLVSVEKARLAKGGAVEMFFQGENSRFIRKNTGDKHEQGTARSQNGSRPF